MIEEAKLVQRLAERDEEAFREFVETHKEVIYRLARSITGNHDDADEATQRTFVTVYKKIGTFQQRSSLRTWLYRIAVNHAKNILRERKRKGDPLPEDDRFTDPAESVDFRIDSARRKLWLRDAADKLPPVQKAVLTLRAVEGLPYSEIARIMGSSETAAKVNYHHAVKKLKRMREEET